MGGLPEKLLPLPAGTGWGAGQIPEVPKVSIYVHLHGMPFRPKAAWVSVPLKFPGRCSTSRYVGIGPQREDNKESIFGG